MTASVRTDAGIVGEIIQNILPKVNEYLDWEYIREHYDEDPTGVAMAVSFVESEDDDEPAETLLFGIAEGPEVILLNQLTPEWEYLGTVMTFQEYGVKIFTPDDEMTPHKARYQYGGVDIYPAEGHSRTRLWYVGSEVLTMVMNTLEYEANNADAGETEVSE